ncbi:hypothetical protein TSAR_011739, partial [Trichomalopsis sarcophagae]
MINQVLGHLNYLKNWEKSPLHIKRNKPKYYQSLMTTPMLDQILRKNYILFTKNIDITSFTNNKRETHNPHGRALPSIVWDYYANGCSVRLLNPQTFVPKLHTLNAILQEFFGCFVGSNSYLTPPNSQGFAPHYDDIEAFILQIEGKKRWRLYKPKTDNEILPRYSSLNFSQQDLGEPILNTVIEAGDILYFPRGTIHQGDTFGFDEHSLHITLSVYQRNSWGDFLEKLIPAALNDAIKNDSRFRKGLPINYLRYIGSTYTENFDCPIREKFSNHTISLLTILSKYINIDKAADLMAVNHIHDFLPPVFNQNERLCSIYDGGEKMIKNGAVINRVEIEPNTLIKLSRDHCARDAYQHHCRESKSSSMPNPAHICKIKSPPKIARNGFLALTRVKEFYKKKLSIHRASLAQLVRAHALVVRNTFAQGVVGSIPSEVTQDFSRVTFNGKSIQDWLFRGMFFLGIFLQCNSGFPLSHSRKPGLIEESEQFRLYYSHDNSKEYHEYEPQFLEVDSEFVPAIKVLFNNYPQYIRVEDLPLNGLDKKVIKFIICF